MFNHMYVISMFTFKNREFTPKDIHLLEVLSCVRFLPVILLHLLKILQLLAVRVSELYYRDLKKYFVIWRKAW